MTPPASNSSANTVVITSSETSSIVIHGGTQFGSAFYAVLMAEPVSADSGPATGMCLMRVRIAVGAPPPLLGWCGSDSADITFFPKHLLVPDNRRDQPRKMRVYPH
jgi:hypothetical protein